MRGVQHRPLFFLRIFLIKFISTTTSATLTHHQLGLVQTETDVATDTVKETGQINEKIGAVRVENTISMDRVIDLKLDDMKDEEKGKREKTE